jgi:hypothetical protein
MMFPGAANHLPVCIRQRGASGNVGLTCFMGQGWLFVGDELTKEVLF